MRTTTTYEHPKHVAARKAREVAEDDGRGVVRFYRDGGQER